MSLRNPVLFSQFFFYLLVGVYSKAFYTFRWYIWVSQFVFRWNKTARLSWDVFNVLCLSTHQFFCSFVFKPWSVKLWSLCNLMRMWAMIFIPGLLSVFEACSLWFFSYINLFFWFNCRVVVLESRPTENPTAHSNLYILAGHENSY